MIIGFRIDEFGNYGPRSFSTHRDLRWYLTDSDQGEIRRVTPRGKQLCKNFLLIVDKKATVKQMDVNILASRLSNKTIYGKVMVLRQSADGQEIYNLQEAEKKFLKKACAKEQRAMEREAFLSHDNDEGDLSPIALNLSYHRKKQNLSQLELAQLVGYRTGESISRIERGLFEPSIERADAIAEQLGITTEELVGGLYV